MFINNLEDHKKKYSSGYKSHPNLNNPRNFDSNYYNKYFCSQSKTQKPIYPSQQLSQQRNTQNSRSSLKASHRTGKNSKIQKQTLKKWMKNGQNMRSTKIQAATSFRNFKPKKINLNDFKHMKSDKLKICDIQTEDLPTRLPFYQSQEIIGNKTEMKLGRRRQYCLTEQKSNFKSQEHFNVETRKFQSVNPIKNSQQDQERYIQFLRNLRFNEVFFCSECFRYIFSIEKHFHFPICQEKIDCSKLPLSEIHSIGHQRVNMIRQLAEYTKTKAQQVNQLIDFSNRQGYNPKMIPKSKFLGIQDIESALILIYQQLVFRK